MKLFISAAIATTAALSANRASAAFPSTVTMLLDKTADPCEDFYQYTCGAWIKNMTIPADELTMDYSFTSIGDRNEDAIEAIMKQNHPILGEFWHSCMNLDKLNELGAKPLHPTLHKIADAKSKKDLLKLAGLVSQTGPSVFVDFDVYADEKDATTNVLYASPAGLTLFDPTYYSAKEFPKYEQAYRKYIRTILPLAGFKDLDVTIAQDAVIRIEKKLAEILLEYAEPDDANQYYNPTKYSKAAAKYSLAFGQLVGGAGYLGKSKLTEASDVVLDRLNYFEKVEAMLQHLALTDLQIYVAFAYTSYNAPYLSDSFQQAHFEFFDKAIFGVQTKTERKEFCVPLAIELLPDLVGQHYALKMFDAQREETVKHMVKLVEEAMGEHVKKLTWLDAATRAEAEKKLAKVTNLIGHSQQKKTYPFTLQRGALIDNIEKIVQNKFANSLKALGNPVDHTEWGISAAEVNAYYMPSSNQMVFPAGILQPPMFSGKSHPSQNFGAIGAIVGHELTHGFDSEGRLYDGDGNKKSWWTPETSAEFDTRAQCLKDQYSKFTVLGENGSPLMNVNGNLTVTENIADNGGLSLAYDAYQKYIKSPKAVVPTDATLSEAEANQLFFISFGQSWCGKMRDGAMKLQLTSDAHSPGQWRVNGAAMNSEEFTKAFQCKTSAKMNPEKKCVLW